MDIALDVLRGTPFADCTFPALLRGIDGGDSALAGATIVLFGARRFEPLTLVTMPGAPPWRGAGATQPPARR